ncbi:retrovirus-related pol polyprotein from transposon TNT 1-94 [Tanacetum coccineum]
MTGTKFYIKKFDETGDFGLWRIKMRALLIQHGCEPGLEVLPADMEAEAKAELNKKAHSTVILCLGNKILRVSQSGYVSKILNNFRIDNGKSVQMPLGGHFKLSLKDCPVRDCDVERMSKVPYANAVGSLMYLMVCTRPDIAYAVSVVSRYLANPGKNHWEAVKWILKYLRGTANVGLVYGTDRGNHVDVTGFVDSDYAKDPDKGRSINGYTFLVQGCVVSWKAMLQHVVALSTTKAEYMALTKAVKEAIWLRGLLEELGVVLNTVAVNCDNQGAIYLSRNHVFPERTKHINVRYHFINEVLEAKTVKVLKVGTEHNVVDALSKVVPGRKLQHCLELLSVADLDSLLLWGPSQVDNHLGGRDGGRFKKLRTDNGLEFCNREFEQLCIESGIARHLIVVGTIRKQNGSRTLYRLDGESPKIVTRRNMVFNESVMYKDTLKDSGAGDKSVKELQVKIKEGFEGVQKPIVQEVVGIVGFTQRAGIDYNEVFSPVVRHTSIRVILSLTACKDYELEQLDVTVRVFIET